MNLPVMVPGLDRAHLLACAQRIDAGPFATLTAGERVNFPNPDVEETERKQLAAYLVERYLRGTRPSPSNTYFGDMGKLIASRLAAETPPRTVRKGGLAALAALALGHVRDFTPPVARAVFAVTIAELYLQGLS